MSVVINTNFAATLAANNLASSNTLLQRSLTRLSSGSKIINPNDDAGGLAVSMKLAATSRRQQAIDANLGNSVSYLQTQDGALRTAGKVLERIGELKTLYADPTKNADDLANYDAEFTQLKEQLTAIAGEEFNGIALFGSSQLSVPTTGGPDPTTLNIGGMNLLGSGTGFTTFTDTFDDLSNWTTGVVNSSGNAYVANTADDLDLWTGTGDAAWGTTLQSFSGPFEVSMEVMAPKDGDDLTFELGGTTLATLSFGSDPGEVAPNSGTLSLSFDGSGSVEITYGGTTVGTQATSATSGQFTIRNDYSGALSGAQLIYFDDLSITSTASGSDYSTVASATDLESLDIDTLKNAIQEVATLRAENGSQQARLGFASEVNDVNRANIEAAFSRIMDVDVAQESTSLAKYNILAQAGASMLSQANQSAQSALRLIG